MIQRTAVVCLEIILALVIGVVLAGSLLAWRLSQGPIVLEGLKPYVETMLSPAGAGFTTAVGATEVSWSGWDRAIDLVARDVAVVEPGGEVRARVDSVSVALSPKALLAGRLAPKRVNVIDPRITIVRTADGGWRLMPEGDEPAGDFDLTGMLQAFSGASPDGPLSDLLEIDVSGARIRLVDDRRGMAMAAHNVSAALMRTTDGLAFNGHGMVSWDGGTRTPIELHGGYRRDDGTVRVEGWVTDLPVYALAALHPTLAPLDEIEVPVSGVVRVETGLTGSGLSGTADFKVGSGRVAVQGLLDRPVDIHSASFRVAVSPDLDRATVDAEVDLSGPQLSVSATAQRAGSGYDVQVDGKATTVPVDDLERYWPATVGPPAREWVTENLKDGTVPQATVRAEAWLDPRDPGTLRLDRLGGQIDFTGVTTHYFRPLPPVVEVDGTAVYDADSFDIALSAGRLDGLSLDPSRVQIRGLEASDEVAEIDVAVRGPLADALRVLDHKPLGYPKKLGLDTSTVGGQAGARLRFEFPLLKDLELEQIKIAASANLAGVMLPGVVAGHALENGELKLDLNGAGMTLAGTGTVLGAASEVSLDQRFHDRGAYTSRGRLVTTGTRERLAAFGLDLEDMVDGTVALAVDSEVRTDGVQRVRVVGDLQQTVLSLPALGWEKPAGSSGVLRTTLTVRDGTPVSVDEFDLKAGDLAVQAVAALGPDARPRTIDLVRLRVGQTDAAGRVERLGSGEWRVALRGSTIDLSPVLDRAKDDAEGSEKPADSTAIDLRVAADKLIISDKATMSRATLAVRRSGKRLDSLEVRGQVGDGYATLTVQPTDGERRLTLRAEDAGEFLRAFEIVDTIQGGRLGVDGKVTGDDLDDGLVMTARIEEFHVVNAPVLAQVLSVASFTGLADTLRGDGIRFSRSRVDLTVSPERIEARNGIAYGPGLGLKTEGAYDRTTDLIDFVGLVAPAYSLSRLIDKIPVFGELLTGGEGEGLLATEFRARGHIDDPSVSVNPLTALAPGFLRELLTTAERPADAPVVEPPSPPAFDPGVKEDRGR